MRSVTSLCANGCSRRRLRGGGKLARVEADDDGAAPLSNGYGSNSIAVVECVGRCLFQCGPALAHARVIVRRGGGGGKESNSLDVDFAVDAIITRRSGLDCWTAAAASELTLARCKDSCRCRVVACAAREEAKKAAIAAASSSAIKRRWRKRGGPMDSAFSEQFFPIVDGSSCDYFQKVLDLRTSKGDTCECEHTVLYESSDS